jgi:hypothetical protein
MDLRDNLHQESKVFTLTYRVFLCFPAFSGWDFSSIFFNQILASKMEADGNPNLALQFFSSVITLGIVFFCVLGAFLG